MSEAMTQMFDVYRVTPEDDVPRRVGEVEMAPDGRLGLIDAVPEFAPRLRAAIAAANGKQAIEEIAPPEAGGDRYDVAVKLTARTDAGFFDALNRFLGRYYGFSLG